MSEFDEKLNQILSNPDTMNQIMSIANALSGSSDGEGGSAPAPPPAPPVESSSAGSNPLTGLTSLLGGGSGGDSPLSGLDPAMLSKAATLMQAYNQGSDDKVALLTAMRPFLREERAARIDKAIQVTKLSRVIKLAMELFRKEGNGLV